VVAFTGERIGAHDEDFRPDLSQHMAAYRASLPFVPGKVVLDGGCGEGYGAKLVAESARLVVGVDSSWETAREAGRFGPRNLHLSCSDLGRLGFRDGSFDVVCCFQAVEHFRQPLLLLQEVARVLRPEGVLVLSTPNRLASFSENPYHFKEYRPEELRELLEMLFPSVEILGVFGSDRVRTLQSSRRRQVTRILRLDPFGLRRVLPQPIQKWAFAKLARYVRRRMRADHLESFGELGPSDFTIGRNPLEESLDLFAICRK
jgi:SAM-dependent methyltransferase